MFLRPHATADEITTGDVLVHQRTGGSAPSDLVTTIQYSMATVPALRFYNDHEGHSATVTYRDPGVPGPPLPGTPQNPFPVSADPDTGEVKITVELWRPQRRPLPGEPGHSDPPSAWTDIGGLLYEVGLGGMGSFCPRDAFIERDSNLSVSPQFSAPGLVDAKAAQLASPGNTLRYTVNLTTCVDSPVITGPRGEEPAPPMSFEPGETQFFGFQAASLSSTNGASATQTIYFRREQ